jgi:hypothetical protein
MPSTAIEWTVWKQGVLSVKYRGGEAYDYLDVPEWVYQELKAAPSKGRFINFVIKPNYKYEKRTH